MARLYLPHDPGARRVGVPDQEQYCGQARRAASCSRRTGWARTSSGRRPSPSGRSRQSCRCPAPVPPMPLTDATEPVGKMIRGQVEDDRRERGIGERRDGEAGHDDGERVGPHRRDQHIIPRPPITAIDLARGADAPAARDQLARDAAAEEVAEIGGEERHPEADQALLELEALGAPDRSRTSR